MWTKFVTEQTEKIRNEIVREIQMILFCSLIWLTEGTIFVIKKHFDILQIE